MLWVDEKRYWKRQRLKRIIIQEARRLRLNRLIQKADENLYYVYPVVHMVERQSGKWKCNCETYLKLGVCSHSLAVTVEEKRGAYP
jgi:hypothetical protein